MRTTQIWHFFSEMAPRLIFMFAFFLGVVLLILAAIQFRPASAESKIPLKSGDLVFQSTATTEALLFERLTDNPYSSMGVVEATPAGIFVIEAVKPVVARTPWAVWWKQGLSHRILVKRFKDLSDADGQSVAAAASSFLGRPFDNVFDWDDEHLYSSELAAKAFERGAHLTVGTTQRLDSLRLGGLEAELEERFGGKPPIDRLVVTPASIAADPKLVEIWTSFSKPKPIE